MNYTTVFRRYEIKYMITPAQKEILLSEMRERMLPDPYGKTVIRNLYFDTSDYRLIRRSMEHPVYKEKLRVRSYRRADADSTVFVELKKKYKGVVYKRRLSMREGEAMDWLCGGKRPNLPSQIAQEIEYALDFYGDLHPVIFLSYEREAFYGRSDPGFRVTFDENILFREDGLTLRQDVGGKPILEDGKILMELKCGGGIPLWMTSLLSREEIRKVSFSKYGRAYADFIYPNKKSVFHLQKENTKND